MNKRAKRNAVPANGVPESHSASRNGAQATTLPPPRFVMPTKTERKRITLIINATLDHNIELFSLATGRMKTDIVVTALSEFLERNNVDPHQDRRNAVRDLLNANGIGSR